MGAHQPAIGEWYRMRSGDLFEVVAVDESDATIEIQYFDGTLEEMEMDDWVSEFAAGDIEEAEAPEDWSGSVDIDPVENRDTDSSDDRRINASSLEGIDLSE